MDNLSGNNTWSSQITLDTASSVGVDGGTVKIAPPLTITAAAILESLQVLEQAFEEAGVKAAAARS